MSNRSGQCNCGGVRFIAEDVELEFSACHCRMCQRWSGGIFLATTVGSVTFTGEDNLKRHKTSDWAERGFCGVCGASLFYHLLKLDQYEMCVGAFDDVDDFVLGSEIFIDRKPGGYSIAGDHPRLTEADAIAKYSEYTD
jgi:hypothetical protein